MASLTQDQLSALLLTHFNDTAIHVSSDSTGEFVVRTALNELLTNYATITRLETEYLTANTIEANYVTTQALTTNYLTATTIGATYATIVDLTAETARVDTLLADYIKATDIVAENISVDTLLANSANFFEAIAFAIGANNVAAFSISSKYLIVEDAFITSAMIHSIDASIVNVTNLVADNITVNTINGQKVLSTVVNETAENVEWIKDQKQYRVEIVSDQGDKLHQSVGTITLFAVVYSWDENITNDLEPSYFRWTRASTDALADAAWNVANMGGKKTITVTGEDVYKKATFFCDLIDPNTGLSLL